MTAALHRPRSMRVAGLALPAVTVLAVAITMVRSGAGLDHRYLAISWQLVDLPVLRDDPLGSVWYLHVQPPLFNLVVGSVLRWSPTPGIGTLFAGYVACLGVTGVALSDLLARWRVHPLAAGVVAALAVTVPGPLGTIVGGSYEVPVAALLVLAAWLAQRHLEAPRPGLLVGLSAAVTAVAMTRSLFHPAWAVAVVALVAVARPVDRRVLAAAVAIPVLVVGGWMVKNQVVVGDATTSSWLGFNLQRGITAPMDAEQVERLVAAGDVTELAQRPPFSRLGDYPEADHCDPDERHRALESIEKAGTPLEVPNFNSSCYLPLYEESRANATRVLRDDPGRYLATRRAAYVIAFRTSSLGVDDPVTTLAGPEQPHRTWMDRLWSAALVPVDASISFDDWNIPLLFGVDRIDVDVSLTLLAGYLVVLARGGWAVVRLARAGWRERATRWPAEEVVWVVALSAAALAVLAAGLVELGENDRFRATIDPFLVALPLGLAVRAVTARLPVRSGTAAPTEQPA